MKNRPIGIFDSGVGGLTVVKEIFRVLPGEKIIYLGDTARVPYGTKSCETIKRFSIENVEFLKRFDVKLIIVACNTASSISLPVLRKKFNIPIVGVIKPGAAKAVKATRNGKIGVIGTAATIRSKAYEKEIRSISKSVTVVSQSCPLFVPLAEEGWLDGKLVVEIAGKYLGSLTAKKIDTLVLGCTHYPLLKEALSKAVGKEVKIVDSAGAVAEEAGKILMKYKLLAARKNTPRHTFFATDDVEQFMKVGEKFLGRKIDKVSIKEIKEYSLPKHL
jgi:glutamate racemase